MSLSRGLQEIFRAISLILYYRVGLRAFFAFEKSGDLIHLLQLVAIVVFAIACIRIKFSSKSNSTPRSVVLVFLSLLLPAQLEIATSLRIFPVIAVILMITGSVISLIALIDLGASFDFLPSDKGIVTSGAYQLVRHPIYTGYVTALAGNLLYNFSAHNLLVTILIWITIYQRASLEEEMQLISNSEYELYRLKVRFRLFPGVI